MAKKRKRYARRRSTKRRVISPYDHHHLLWMKNRWSNGPLGELRLYPYCIVIIPRDTLHRFIHSEMWQIPPPKPVNAKATLDQLKMLAQRGAIHDDDPIEKRLELLAALFDCVEQPTADALREQLSIIHRFNKKAPQ